MSFQLDEGTFCAKWEELRVTRDDLRALFERLPTVADFTRLCGVFGNIMYRYPALLPIPFCSEWNAWLKNLHDPSVTIELLENSDKMKLYFGDRMYSLFFNEGVSVDDILEELGISQLSEHNVDTAKELARIVNKSLVEKLEKLVYECEICDLHVLAFSCTQCEKFFCEHRLNFHGCSRQVLTPEQRVHMLVTRTISDCQECGIKTPLKALCDWCNKVKCRVCMYDSRVCKQCAKSEIPSNLK